MSNIVSISSRFTQNTFPGLHPAIPVVADHGGSGAVQRVGRHVPLNGLNQMTADQIIEAISFPVVKKALVYEHNGIFKPSGQVSVVRTDTGHELGVVSPSYGLVTHREALEPALEAMSDLNFSFKGVAMKDNGRRILIDAVVPDMAVKINGDDHVPRAILINSYDGSTAIKLQFGFYRMVCMNGMIVPSFQGSTFDFKTSHKSNAGAVVAQWRRACGDYRWINAAKESFEALNTPINKDLAKTILAMVFNAQKNASGKENKNVETAMSKALYGQGQNGDLTRWSLYNGITETVRDSVNSAKPDQVAGRMLSGNDRILRALAALQAA